jgi:DNA repair protein SbcC/Rad50
MQPLVLTLKGFRGIRDGLGLDVLTLDLDRLADGAQLVAIAGANGCGKTTIMDSLQPYLTLPSRAVVAGSGGFSYYDHVCLPESEKDLTWAHEGCSYRSQVVIRLNGRRRTEAFLHVLDDTGRWQPVRLDDGTVSDGNVETYTRCVEAICGSADTFFTSVFSAQGKRQLSTYRNAEIKTLLADLLGLEEIRKLGVQAAETAKLIRAGLVSLRNELGALKNEEGSVHAERARLGDVAARTATAARERVAAQTSLDAAKSKLAQLTAERDVAQQTAARRRQLNDERAALIDAGKRASAALDEQDRREADRLGRLERRITTRSEALRATRTNLEQRRVKLADTLRRTPHIAHAARRLPLAERLTTLREQRVRARREAVTRFDALSATGKQQQSRLDAIEREAGQVALRAQELARRFALTAEVPCSGTDLQGRCTLLGDAREAKALKPAADAQIARLGAERAEILVRLCSTTEALVALNNPRHALVQTETRLQRARQRSGAFAVAAARAGEIEQSRSEWNRIDAELNTLPTSDAGQSDESDEDRIERRAITDARAGFAQQRAQERQRYRESIASIDEVLAALPAPFDMQKIAAAERAIAVAQRSLAATDAAHLNAIRDQQVAVECEKRIAALGTRIIAVEARLAKVERTLGVWRLFAKCLSNDGVIALAIDDAGPQLASLANDLLLACYGPRFTVSIKTLVETAKGEPREGFDIVVHDAESGESKSVTAMSGGERVWIDHALTRAIALYLAQDSGRRYRTLFCDEADGPLDPERKRMFMAMKREVLRLGGYEQEFFVSQTPALAAMADVIIDLEALRSEPQAAANRLR